MQMQADLLLYPFGQYVILGLYWGYIGDILGIMEKKMEATIFGSGLGVCKWYCRWAGHVSEGGCASALLAERYSVVNGLPA